MIDQRTTYKDWYDIDNDPELLKAAEQIDWTDPAKAQEIINEISKKRKIGIGDIVQKPLVHPKFDDTLFNLWGENAEQDRTNVLYTVANNESDTDPDTSSPETPGTNTGENTTAIVKLQTAKRHTIRINDIAAIKNRYIGRSIMVSRELITEPVTTMALFCNEYIPKHFTNQNCIKYIMTVNGKDYEIAPINSQKNGKKIIRTVQYNLPMDSILYITETIKSAKLTIIISAPNSEETPYISNLKILFGGE
jgi:hypothetical protein